jgi:O-antigen/teichoic acid export membrane protein
VKNLSDRLLDNLKAGIIQRVITALFPIASLPALVNTWGLDLYGEWLLISALPTYLMLAPDLGAANAALNRIGFAAGSGDFSQANKTFQSSYLLLLVCSLGFCLLGLLAATLVPVKKLLNLSLMDRSEITLILIFLLLSISVQQIHFITSAYYRASARNARFGLWLSMRSLAQVALLGIVLIFSLSPVTYAACGLAIFLIFLVLVTIDGARLRSGLQLGYTHASTAEMRSLVKPGLGFAAYPLLHSLQNQGILIIVGGILGPAAAASFGAMRTLANTSRSLFGLFVASINVEAARAIGEKKAVELKSILGKMHMISFAMFLMGAIVTFSIAEPIYRKWAGPDAIWSAPLVLAILFSILGLGLASAHEITISAKNLLHHVALPLLLLLGIYLGITYWLLTAFGFTGLIVSQALWGILFLVFYHLPAIRKLSRI